MTDKHVQSEAPHSNMEKDPSTWVTGDEPMTGAQKSYLKTLSEEAKADFDESLTKAEASERIDELQQQTGRGTGTGTGDAHGHDHHQAHAKPPAPRKATAKAEAADDEADAADAGEEDPGAAEGDLFEAERTRAEYVRS